MEAHDVRPQLLDSGAVRLGERRMPGAERQRRRFGAKLGVIGREAIEPRPILLDGSRVGGSTWQKKFRLSGLLLRALNLGDAGADLHRL